MPTYLLRFKGKPYNWHEVEAQTAREARKRFVKGSTVKPYDVYLMRRGKTYITGKYTDRPKKAVWKKYGRMRRIDKKLFIYFGHSQRKLNARKRVLTEKAQSDFKVSHHRILKSTRKRGYDIWLRYGGKKGSKW